MTALGTLLLALLLAQGHGVKGAGAKKASAAHGGEAQKRPARARGAGGGAAAADNAGDGAAERSPSSGSDVGNGATTGKGAADDSAGGKTTMKTKTYNFGAMDVEGKLKTPQLLYFLNRVKLELDMSAPDKRSFMKELEKSADDKSL